MHVLCDLSFQLTRSFLASLSFILGPYAGCSWAGRAGRLVQLPPGSSDALGTEAGFEEALAWPGLDHQNHPTHCLWERRAWVTLHPSSGALLGTGRGYPAGGSWNNTDPPEVTSPF